MCSGSDHFPFVTDGLEENGSATPAASDPAHIIHVSRLVFYIAAGRRSGTGRGLLGLLFTCGLGLSQ